jgi:hypothetical protein
LVALLFPVVASNEKVRSWKRRSALQMPTARAGMQPVEATLHSAVVPKISSGETFLGRRDNYLSAKTNNLPSS